MDDARTLISIDGLGKRYASGFVALKRVDLRIREGEILAMLGPNGAGKTTLISIVCGLVSASEGSVTVAGHDVVKDYRASRALIGLVPQELTTDAFETVWATVTHSRGLWGLKPDPALIERILRDLTLWEKKDSRIMTLSGGMKRRVMIAKALSHEPRILFLDEPTAGVDVELRKDMWKVVGRLREGGVTLILTTHYIEEAEEIADRVAVINGGEIILVEDKDELMRKLGKKTLRIELAQPLPEPGLPAALVDALPAPLTPERLELSADRCSLLFTYDRQAARSGIDELLNALRIAGIAFRDLQTEQSSLEEIFIDLVKRPS
ncbi:MAG: ABC transporter ATP-binding protein [Lautropia sp.]